jgi:hypothetical protein
MSIKETLRNWWLKARKQSNHHDVSDKGPLREFIYLDEVSLKSLYASQVEGIDDVISEGTSKAVNAELAAELSADALVGKGKFNPRFQTSNSQSVQTTRKVVVQSLFRNFRNLNKSNIYLSTPEDTTRFASVSEIESNSDSNFVLSSHKLRRGDLIEIRVELSVDPVFKISTLVSEFLEMAKSTPELAEMAGVGQQLQDAKPANSFFQHLLAGLIPLRSRAIDYCVVNCGSGEYIVPKSSIKNLQVESYPLEIVGVTEHLSYWKDIRRVLFSSGQFTMLCRISRDGIQKSWTPVKMVDLLDTVAPDFRKQIDSFKEMSFAPSLPVSAQSQSHEALEKALRFFHSEYLARVGNDQDIPQDDVHQFIAGQVANVDIKSISGQNEAFRNLIEYLQEDDRLAIDPDTVLELRKEARSHSGLELFNNSTVNSTVSVQSNDNTQDRMIDTEIIAIYW